MDLRDCIPSSKFDVEAVESAEAVGFPALDQILPDLLIWIQDMNWPVAAPMAALLRKAGPSIVPHLLEVLRSDDDVWKYWVLRELVPDLPTESFSALQADIERILAKPSRGEAEEGLPEEAQKLLNQRRISTT